MKHPLGRPPLGASDVLRLRDDGRWVKDDGKPGRAFSGQMTIIGRHTGKPIPIPAAFTGPTLCSLGCPDCPTRKALDKTCKRYGAANGRDMVLPKKLKSKPIKKSHYQEKP